MTETSKEAVDALAFSLEMYAMIVCRSPKSRQEIYAAAAMLRNLRAELDRAEARVAKLETALVEERIESLWNAYHTGAERDGKWDHCCMSDGEWLARECGFNPSDREYDAEAIKKAIPKAAHAALADKGGE